MRVDGCLRKSTKIQYCTAYWSEGVVLPIAKSENSQGISRARGKRKNDKRDSQSLAVASANAGTANRKGAG